MKKIIGIIVIAILFISASVLFMQSQRLKKEISILNTKISDLEKQKQELENKPPIGWKEYIDEKYKFRVWYPGETIYKVIILEDNNPKYILRSFIIGNQASMDVPPKLLYIYIYNKNITDIKKFIKEEERRINLSDEDLDKYLTQDKINGLDAYKFKMSDNFVNYYIKKNNLMFVLVFDNEARSLETTNEMRTVFNQMVQSFRFTD